MRRADGIYASTLFLNFKLNSTHNEIDYLQNMKKMFGEDLLSQAQKVIKNEISFYGLEKTSMNLEGFEMHQKLITSYEKLQKAKGQFIK
jgi:ribosomal protein S12 methylthiotransferase accessory factor